MAFGVAALATLMIIFARLFFYCGNFLRRKEIFVHLFMVFFLGIAGFCNSGFIQNEGYASDQAFDKLFYILFFS